MKTACVCEVLACACVLSRVVCVCFLNGARVQPFITRADCRQGNAQISPCSLLTRDPAARWTFLRLSRLFSAPERDPATARRLPAHRRSGPVAGIAGFVPRGGENLAGYQPPTFLHHLICGPTASVASTCFQKISFFFFLQIKGAGASVPVLPVPQ